MHAKPSQAKPSPFAERSPAQGRDNRLNHHNRPPHTQPPAQTTMPRMVVFVDLENVGASLCADLPAFLDRLRALRPGSEVVRGYVAGKMSCFTQDSVDRMRCLGFSVLLASRGRDAADRVLIDEMQRVRAELGKEVTAVLVSGDHGFASSFHGFSDRILIYNAAAASAALVKSASEAHTVQAMHERPPKPDSAKDGAPSPRSSLRSSLQSKPLPWLAIHVAALYRCGRVGRLRMRSPPGSTVTPAALAIAYEAAHGRGTPLRARRFCASEPDWVEEVASQNNSLQLYVPSDALFARMDDPEVHAYIRAQEWTPIEGWSDVPEPRRPGNPGLTRQLMQLQIEIPDPAATSPAAETQTPEEHQQKPPQQQHLEEINASDSTSIQPLTTLLARVQQQLAPCYSHPELNVFLYSTLFYRE
jgi:hypothetical protein